MPWIFRIKSFKRVVLSYFGLTASLTLISQAAQLFAFHSNCGRFFSRFDTIHERDQQAASHLTSARAALWNLARVQSRGKNRRCVNYYKKSAYISSHCTDHEQEVSRDPGVGFYGRFWLDVSAENCRSSRLRLRSVLTIRQVYVLDWRS